MGMLTYSQFRQAYALAHSLGATADLIHEEPRVMPTECAPGRCDGCGGEIPVSYTTYAVQHPNGRRYRLCKSCNDYKSSILPPAFWRTDLTDAD